MRILLVHDDEGVLKALRRDLVRLHGELEAFRQPREALARAGSEVFDVVIAGYQMPGMNGPSLAKALKRQQPDIQVIMLSGLADLGASMRERGEIEVFRYLTRPWDADGLCAIVDQAVAQRAGGRSEARNSATTKPRGALAELEARYPGITQPGAPWPPADGGTHRR